MQKSHPKGLYLLFGVEMWERFSYYGMRALLMLYMVKFLQFDMTKAGAIYGTYTGLVYFTPLIGGYLADRYLGARMSVFIGGSLMALGHFAMAFPDLPYFYTALGLLILGNGFFKPNISTIVGSLYKRDDPRLDGAFTIFYMGINLGAFFSPLVCGTLGENVGWHWGFGAAGVGMVAGLIMYLLGGKKLLGDIGVKPAIVVGLSDQAQVAALKKESLKAYTMIAGMVFVIVMTFSNTLVWNTWWVGLGAVLLVFSTLMSFVFKGSESTTSAPLTKTEKQRIAVILILTSFSIIFWSAFEQAGSSLTIFADRSTDRLLDLPLIGQWEMPASWFQSVNPLLIFIFAPFASRLWVSLADKGLNPSTPMKFVYALSLLGLGFVLMMGAAAVYVQAGPVSVFWLFGVYFLHTMGELCLSPVGLSMVSKLSPARFTSMLMGCWLMSSFFANFLGGYFAGEYENMDPVTFFTVPIATAFGAAALLLILVKVLRRWMNETPVSTAVTTAGEETSYVGPKPATV